MTASQALRRLMNTGSSRPVSPAAKALRPRLLRATTALAALPPSLRTRSFHASQPSRHGGLKRPEPGTGLKVTFKDSKDNVIRTVECNEGDDLLSVAHEYDIDLEGACERSCSCSTCHVILTDPEVYDRLLEDQDMSDDEADMLDLAFGLTETSRLGCQVLMKPEFDGLTVKLPAATRNMRVDGSKPTHH